MASTPLNIDVAVKGQQQIDRLNKSLGRTTRASLDLGGALRLAGAAFAAVGVAKFSRSIVQTGKTVENLGLRLKFLFGSAEEGSKAFDTLSKFAGTVPFSLEEIAAASGNLAVVSKDAEELGKNLQLTANVAAISGLDFQVAGEQIQRALSGGISAADLLRERGIKNLLGFKDGVKVTAEETAEAFDRVFGPDGRFGNASVAMANTLDGLQSMVGDKFFNIKKIIADSGPFDTLKATVSLLDKALTKNFDNIEKGAQAFGAGFVHTVERFILGTAGMIDFVSPLFIRVQKGFNSLIAFTNGLPGYIKTLGVIGFLALGIKGKLIVAVIGSVTDKIIGLFANIMDGIASGKETIANFYEAIGNDSGAKALRENADQIRKSNEKIRASFVDMSQTVEKDAVPSIEEMILKLEENPEAFGGATTAALEFIAALREEKEALKETENAINGMITKNKTLEDGQKSLTFTVQDFKDAFMKTFDEMIEKFDPAQQAVQLLIGTFQTFKRGVGDAFADALMGTKSLSEALGELGKQILKQLISGLIQLALEIFVFDAMRRKIDSIRNSQKGVNSELKKEIGLRAVLAFFTGGSSIGIPFLADGGPAAANQPVIVGEEGPEIFVPRSAGTVMSNDDSFGSGGSVGGGEGDNINVTFNINTIDATDFNELLTTRQELIIGLINRGLAERGKRSLTA